MRPQHHQRGQHDAEVEKQQPHQEAAHRLAGDGRVDQAEALLDAPEPHLHPQHVIVLRGQDLEHAGHGRFELADIGSHAVQPGIDAAQVFRA